MPGSKDLGSAAPAWLTVARIVKTQGRRGEVAAEILTDFPEKLCARKQVWLWDGSTEPRPVPVARVWPHKSFLIFQFAGCDSISQAKELVGQEIQIPRPQAAELETGRFYEHDLVGCRVVEQGSGRELGRVRELVTTGGTPVLAVEASNGREVLIPFAEEFCPRIAPAEKVIEVALPQGLLSSET
ncbi:MAG: ribosome maturation factor RimM [Terriglobia bacterium]